LKAALDDALARAALSENLLEDTKRQYASEKQRREEAEHRRDVSERHIQQVALRASEDRGRCVEMEYERELFLERQERAEGLLEEEKAAMDREKTFLHSRNQGKGRCITCYYLISIVTDCARSAQLTFSLLLCYLCLMLVSSSLDNTRLDGSHWNDAEEHRRDPGHAIPAGDH
jgi:hypothetical protein